MVDVADTVDGCVFFFPKKFIILKGEFGNGLANNKSKESGVSVCSLFQSVAHRSLVVFVFHAVLPATGTVASFARKLVL
jgi:hypothetical protein